ncbi:MAG: hypothetical protein Q7T14_04650 [Aestuariivirga sp.]|nr:hypothetical protein [Aestuariivirga sp.]
MVTKYVNYEYEGDLLNLADNFGLGNDTLYLSIPSPSNAVIKTYQGNDHVTVTNQVSTSNAYKFYLGTGNDTLVGSNQRDYYYDEGGDDQINMGAGADFVTAGLGNDTINGGAGGDTIIFGHLSSNGGSLPIAQGVTLNLGSTGPQDLGIYGNDIIINFSHAFGGEGNDTFLGTNAFNALWGGRGADYLRGLGGNDSIIGGTGNDTLIGDAGADELDAGFAYLSETETDGDPDIIKYFRISDSSVDDGVDTIFNFEHFTGGGGDKIDLSYLDATSSLVGNQTFQFVGSAAFSSANGEVRLIEFGGDTLVWVDNDSDATAEMVIVVDGVTGLTADDFIL